MSFEQVAPRRSIAVWIVVLFLVAAAAIAAYIVFGRRAAQPVATVPARPAETKAPEAAPVALPPLDQSDAFVADLVRKLSSHPQVAAWLTTEGLIRNFTVAVLNVSEGKTPARSLRPLRPQAPFRIVDRDRATYIDARSYERYSPLAEAVASIDAQGAASLYTTLKPRIDEAYRDLGQPEGSFDRTLEQAIVLLLQTPVRDGTAKVQPHGGTVYAYADPKEENLTAAQKQLLRMGPANARVVQAKLREIALALGISPQRLPR